MAAEIAKEFRIEPELIVGAQGIFDVVVDDSLIFSKDDVGRFPESEEILQKIKTAQATP